MSNKEAQIDLEEAIAKTPKRPQGEIQDAFTGVLFTARTRNHYEVPNPVPFAPQLQVQRPTVRQRIENLLSRGVDPLQDYVRQSQEDDELAFDVPDDPEAPLTQAEQVHLDLVAAEIAEQAPLPDEGMPRPPAPASEVPKPAPTPGGGEAPVATTTSPAKVD